MQGIGSLDVKGDLERLLSVLKLTSGIVFVVFLLCLIFVMSRVTMMNHIEHMGEPTATTYSDINRTGEWI